MNRKLFVSSIKRTHESIYQSINYIMLRKKKIEPLPGLQNNLSLRWILPNDVLYPSTCMFPRNDRFSKRNSNSNILIKDTNVFTTYTMDKSDVNVVVLIVTMSVLIIVKMSKTFEAIWFTNFCWITNVVLGAQQSRHLPERPELFLTTEVHKSVLRTC